MAPMAMSLRHPAVVWLLLQEVAEVDTSVALLGQAQPRELDPGQEGSVNVLYPDGHPAAKVATAKSLMGDVFQLSDTAEMVCTLLLRMLKVARAPCRVVSHVHAQ